MAVELFAEPECWEFRKKLPDDWQKFGCGPGWLLNPFVPDKVFGASIREACRIHDWYYRFYEGDTEQDRIYADRIFLNNMIRLIVEHRSSKYMIKIQVYMAYRYYLAVRRYGALAFFGDRNSSENLSNV